MMIGVWGYCATYFLLAWFSYRDARRAEGLSQAVAVESGPWPSVSVIKPVRGLSDTSEKNFRSWIAQAYAGEYELVFSFQDAKDPALPLVQKLLVGFPRAQILINPIRAGFIGKTSNLHYGVQAAKGELLVFSDADIYAPSETLQKLVSQLRPGNRVVSCLPKTVEAQNLWANCYAMCWNTAILYMWGAMMVRGNAPGIAGGTVGIARADLERIGGVSAFRDFVAEDLEMGGLAKRHGLELTLGSTVTTQAERMSFRELFQKFMRANLVGIHQGQGNQLIMFCVYIYSYGYWALLGLGQWWALALVIVIRLLSLSGLYRLAERKRYWPWYFPLSDLLLMASYLYAWLHPRFSWGGVEYRIGSKGRLEIVETA